MQPESTELSGGMSTASVVRIGNRVHRSLPNNYEFVHTTLLQLEQLQFPYSPRFLGIDAAEREILTYLPGTVPREIPMNLSQQITAAKILRQLHDLLAESPLSADQETVCHNDFAPWNLIVQGADVTGIIDFDEAAPGNRIDDLAYYVWTCLDYGNTMANSKSLFEDMLTLIRAYGTEFALGFCEATLAQQKRILTYRETIVRQASDPKLSKFSQGAILRIKKSINWIQANADNIEANIKEILINGKN